MTAVVDFLEFKSQTVTPTLVLVGLHRQPDASPGDLPAYAGVLANCRNTLEHARAHHFPVAHVRTIAPKSASDRQRYPAWIPGFEPARSDMVFDVLQPSCYSNSEFARVMDYSRGNFVIAGLYAETNCLSTAVDAHHRRHGFTYISDASACRRSGALPAAVFHDAISQAISCYGKVARSGKWGFSLSCAGKIP
ncbi:MAG: cysteine hydrolase family protein [Rhizomicrobium sp.]